MLLSDGDTQGVKQYTANDVVSLYYDYDYSALGERMTGTVDAYRIPSRKEHRMIERILGGSGGTRYSPKASQSAPRGELRSDSISITIIISPD